MKKVIYLLSLSFLLFSCFNNETKELNSISEISSTQVNNNEIIEPIKNDSINENIEEINVDNNITENVNGEQIETKFVDVSDLEIYNNIETGISFSYDKSWTVNEKTSWTVEKRISVTTNKIMLGNFLDIDFNSNLSVEFIFSTNKEILSMDCWMCFWKELSKSFINNKWEKIYLKIYIHEISGQICLECLVEENFKNSIKYYNDLYYPKIKEMIKSLKIIDYTIFDETDYKSM